MKKKNMYFVGFERYLKKKNSWRCQQQQKQAIHHVRENTRD